MEKSILKIVLYSLLTLVLPASVYSQDNTQSTGLSESKIISLNTIKKKKARDVIRREEEAEKISLTGVRKKSQAKKATFNSNSDYITMVEGKTFVKKNGKFLPVKKERVVGEMKVLESGEIQMKDGTSEMLQEGEAMTIEGAKVKANETEVLKQRVSTLYESCTSLHESSWKTQDVVGMLKAKSVLMDKKMDLVNQKMILIVDFMDHSAITHQEREDYKESISLLDNAIRNVELDIREIDELMPKESIDY